ncbi:hypothetical protein HanRHA438_Chr04g0160351 [Helianthus annuus]|nr:hypothetical protein HanHA89_Chr04g0136301 [Helianthus annuus]KAJ0925492.1 hypothetical protein HanRHA438_Chr04g0160351 [Helianthus annuus]
MMSFDLLEVGSQASTLVTQIRKRKGLKEQMTPLSEFEDKLLVTILVCFGFTTLLCFILVMTLL